MNRKIHFIPLFLFFLLCPQLTYSQPLSNSEVYDLLKNGLVVYSESDESQVKSQLGEPVDIRIEKVNNPYRENKDIVTHFIYPGLKISFYECRDPNNKWKIIVCIEVSSQQYKLKYGIRPGMLLKEVDQLFQGRERQTWESPGLKYVSFSMPDSVHDQINFAIKDGVVQQVIWSDWP